MIKRRRVVLARALPALTALTAACVTRDTAHLDPSAPGNDSGSGSGSDPGPGPTPMLTLLEVRAGVPYTGSHSAPMVTGAERVIFDPAGSFGGSGVAVHDNIIRDVSEPALDLLMAFQTPDGFAVVRHDLPVTPEVPSLALTQFAQRPATTPGGCACTVAKVLGGLPGFPGFDGLMMPDRFFVRFAALLGVRETVYRPTDWPTLHAGRAAWSMRSVIGALDAASD